MAKPSEKLAESLSVLRRFEQQGRVAIRSGEISRSHRERLCRNGFLKEVLKGWYIPGRPDEAQGETATWYAAFWRFCAVYLKHLKNEDWCLCPEQSILLHAENWTVPRQLLVRANKARNNVTPLPYETSLLVIRALLPRAADIVEKDGLRLYAIPAALVACSPTFFREHPTELRAVMAMVRDASELLRILLEGGHSTIAGRLTGAFRNLHKERVADDILQTMRAAGHNIRETDPFEKQTGTSLPAEVHSPLVNRIRLMWKEMRTPIIERFPEPHGLPNDTNAYLTAVEEGYVSDAYHSLSIEGFKVSRELIERVRSGQWNPEQNANDLQLSNSVAARGYWQAYQKVRQSIEKVITGSNAGRVAEEDHRMWYRELFTPSVASGLLRAADLSGYRTGAVFIRGSMHVPPRHEAVRDAMPVLFDLLSNEQEPAVRVVMGHFVFVYLHPYMDGNGRIGRFLMNVMMASGGYPWTMVPVSSRSSYMDALEQASVHQRIEPFTDFLASLLLNTD